MSYIDQEYYNTICKIEEENKPICKNCKYFSYGKPQYTYGKYGGICNSGKIEYDGSGLTEKEKDMFKYCDGEEYSAWCVVGERFGCIHFFKKEGVK